jgi:hypothetical protein
VLRVFPQRDQRQKPLHAKRVEGAKTSAVQMISTPPRSRTAIRAGGLPPTPLVSMDIVET